MYYNDKQIELSALIFWLCVCLLLIWLKGKTKGKLLKLNAYITKKYRGRPIYYPTILIANNYISYLFNLIIFSCSLVYIVDIIIKTTIFISLDFKLDYYEAIV